MGAPHPGLSHGGSLVGSPDEESVVTSSEVAVVSGAGQQARSKQVCGIRPVPTHCVYSVCHMPGNGPVPGGGSHAGGGCGVPPSGCGGGAAGLSAPSRMLGRGWSAAVLGGVCYNLWLQCGLVVAALAWAAHKPRCRSGKQGAGSRPVVGVLPPGCVPCVDQPPHEVM